MYDTATKQDPPWVFEIEVFEKVGVPHASFEPLVKSAAERRGNTLKRFQDFHLKAEASIWPLTVLYVPDVGLRDAGVCLKARARIWL